MGPPFSTFCALHFYPNHRGTIVRQVSPPCRLAIQADLGASWNFPKTPEPFRPLGPSFRDKTESLAGFSDLPRVSRMLHFTTHHVSRDWDGVLDTRSFAGANVKTNFGGVAQLVRATAS